MKHHPFYRNLGYFLFLLGALSGILFIALATWADFEASNFEVSLSSDTTLPSLRCPVLISPQEAGTIRASFSNLTDEKLTRRVRFHVSQGVATVMEEEFVALSLAPGEHKTLAWSVDSRNMVWERLILALVYQHRNHPLPSRSSACGVIVADIFGLPGSFVTGIAMAGSPLLLVSGFLLWKHHSRSNPGTTRRISDRELSMQILAVIISVGILTILLGQWMVGAILLVIATLLVYTILGHLTLS